MKHIKRIDNFLIKENNNGGIQYRDHTGSFDESMKTIQHFNSFNELKKYLKNKYNDLTKIEFSYSTFDKRNDWDTYNVIVYLNNNDYFVAGMSDGKFETTNEGKYEDLYDESNEKNGEFPIEQRLGFNEFDTSFNWIKMFGGESLLSSRHIRSGMNLLDALKDGRITINEIDIATEGDNGQAGSIPFSETTIAKNTVIPYLEEEKVTESLKYRK